jgi:sulfoxide reductase heme-binding subunit YedZ
MIPWLWWFIRVSGLVAYGATWLAAVFGVMLGGRGAGGLAHAASLAKLHEPWAVLGVIAAVAHAVVSVAAPEGGVTPLALVVPGVSDSLRVGVTLGTLALWGIIALVVTSWLRARIGLAVWRAVHSASFGVFVLVAGHGWLAGTDVAGGGAARDVFLATQVVFAAAVAQRLVLVWVEAPPRDRAA